MNLVLAISLAEGLFLFAYHRSTGRGLGPEQYAMNLVAGLCLMAATRLVAPDLPAKFSNFADSQLLLIACLFAAGLAHWFDLYQRWKGLSQK
jgi:hypothetical protein